MSQLEAGAGVAQVVNRCRSAKEDKRLDLSDCKLIQVPEAVYFLMKNVGVESINLTNNAIPRLPTKFAVIFPQLSELCLQRNKFSNLPDELKELTSLEMLDISYNNFTRLPNVTYKFSKLKFLNAENNSITSVDTDLLRDMTNLEEVNLYRNPLPDTLQKSLSSEVLFTVLVVSISRPFPHSILLFFFLSLSSHFTLCSGNEAFI
ncbi:unnamed protein product [Acanthosepion pharaonis]|uniref:Leucine-rich repeat-containing protein 20 n=1 Tax=Acanthosepion pharaonis TaxID=158019 RepID=A0A812BN33_ACAPH|nr:unnamed protein product [Sepia pharaonis]